MASMRIADGPRALALILLGLLSSACQDGDPVRLEVDGFESRSAALPSGVGNEPLKVMTRNVYLGGNTGLVFGADFGDPVAVVTAAATVWAQVRASDIPARARAVVDEIETTHPHVVSVQEAFRFASTSGLVLDWMDELEAEIVRRGLPYRTVTVQQGTSATLPVSPTELVTFTDRIAVLAREDVPVTTLDRGRYQAELLLASAPPPIGDVVVRRGWIRVGTELDGIRYHVVATHLETQAIRPVHDLQAQELIGTVTAGLDGVTIVAGDLNSDAAGRAGDPSWTPTYGAMLAAGFADAWLRSADGRTETGFTCCHDPDLRNGSSTLDERIDFILVRTQTPAASSVDLAGSVRAEILGEEVGDRLANGLWPSDHAGLVAALRLPPGFATSD